MFDPKPNSQLCHAFSRDAGLMNQSQGRLRIVLKPGQLGWFLPGVDSIPMVSQIHPPNLLRRNRPNSLIESRASGTNLAVA